MKLPQRRHQFVTYGGQTLRRRIVAKTALGSQPLLADGAEIDRGPTADVAASETGPERDRDHEGAEDECNDIHTVEFDRRSLTTIREAPTECIFR